MKNAKRLSARILTIALFLSLAVFTACVDKPQPQELTELTLPTLDKDQMAVVIKNGDKDYTSVTVTLGKNGVNAKTVEDVLEYLEKEDVIKLEWHDTEYGKYIDKIGKLAPSSGQWVSVFTSNSAEYDVSAYAKTYTVGEKTIVTAAAGVSALTVSAGFVIYFELGSM